MVSAILTEALQADYWKPVQAGNDGLTDSQWVQQQLSNSISLVHKECYNLELAASPHKAARAAQIQITVENICAQIPDYNRKLIIEGAGGLMVPLNEREFMPDLIKACNAKLILVSRNYLGSIHHSISTALASRALGLDVLGWCFIGYDRTYENEITDWTGIPGILSVPLVSTPDKSFVKAMAESLRESSIDKLC